MQKKEWVDFCSAVRALEEKYWTNCEPQFDMEAAARELCESSGFKLFQFWSVMDYVRNGPAHVR